MNKLTLIINGQEQADKKKTAAIPSKKPWRPGQRRGGDAIEFYDLGQVSGDGVTFTDHPLLKIPTFSVSFEVFSPGDMDGTALYDMQGFGNADYQAYTDMMFEVPIEEWHQRYKRLDYELPLAATYTGIAAYTSYPSFITLMDKNGDYGAVMRAGTELDPIPVGVGEFMIDPILHSDPVAYAQEMREVVGMAWDASRMKYRGLTNLEMATGIYETSPARGPSFFPFSTSDKTNYKVTATYDYDADDVGTLAPSGLTRIFMMPQIVCWAAVTASSDLLTRYVLGPVYQVTPRRKWPRYVDREWYHHEGAFSVGATSCLGIIDDPDNRKYDFFEYQMARGGMQASSWSRTSLGDLFTNSSYDGAMSPVTWPSSNDNYVSQAFTSDGNTLIFDFGNADNPYRGDVNFTASASSSSSFFESSDPFLCAVIQKGSSFYYVWMNPAERKPEDQVSRQGKYRLTLRQDDAGQQVFDDAEGFSI